MRKKFLYDKLLSISKQFKERKEDKDYLLHIAVATVEEIIDNYVLTNQELSDIRTILIDNFNIEASLAKEITTIEESNCQPNEENFVRITVLENLAKYLSKDNQEDITYEEQELILKKLMCDYDNTSLQDSRTLQGLQNLRNYIVKYFSICIKKEKEKANFTEINKYEIAENKVITVLDKMIIYKRRP